MTSEDGPDGSYRTTRDWGTVGSEQSTWICSRWSEDFCRLRDALHGDAERWAMTVSAGVGGGTLVGVVLGGGAATAGGKGSGVTEVVRSLPFTGAPHFMVLISIALVLLVAGVLALGLARRGRQSSVPDPC